MNSRFITIAIAMLLAGIIGLHAEGWVRINQLGYLPQATKVAVLMSQEDIDITAFELVDAYTGQTAYRSTSTRAMGP